jgi:GT2 family glycosyltransferase
MNKKLAILMVVHNEKHNFEMLFNSLFNQTYRNFKIFFIDNNSTDGSVSFAKELNKKYSLEIEFVELMEETGYTGGNNIGAQKALKQGYEFIFIINNDIELEKNCILELLNLIESKKNAGAVGPILLFWNIDKKINKIQDYGVMVDFKKQTKAGLYSGSLYESVSLNKVEKVDMITGAAVLIRVEFIKKYGLFDQDFFIYNDELDLANRLRKSGLDCYVTEKAKVWHNHDFSKKNIIGYRFMYYYMMRNRILYFKKFKLYPQLFIDLFLQIIYFPIKVKMFFKIGSVSILKYYYSGLLDGLLGKKGITNKSFD